MRYPYMAPIAAARGNVVRNTLGSKPPLDESLNMATRVPGGGSLSFGL